MAPLPPSAREGSILTGTREAHPVRAGLQGTAVLVQLPVELGPFFRVPVALTRRKLFTVSSAGSRHDPLWLFRLRKGQGGLERPRQVSEFRIRKEIRSCPLIYFLRSIA